MSFLKLVCVFCISTCNLARCATCAGCARCSIVQLMEYACFLQKLLPCRDPDSHRKARSAHRPKLDEIRAAAFPDAAGAGPGGKTAPKQRPLQRQQSLQHTKSQQLQQQLQRQLHVKTAAPSSRPGPDAVAAADSPREQGAALIKGTGAKGDNASLPSSPTAAADTPTAAQACRGKPKVTEIFGKSSLLAPTMAQLQQKSSRLSSQGLGGMPDWDAPAARATGKGQSDSADTRAVAAAQRDAPGAAEQAAAPGAATDIRQAQQPPQQWVPTDPRLRFNHRNSATEATPESNMPKAEVAQTKQEPSHPQPSPNGMIYTRLDMLHTYACWLDRHIWSLFGMVGYGRDRTRQQDTALLRTHFN